MNQQTDGADRNNSHSFELIFLSMGLNDFVGEHCSTCKLKFDSYWPQDTYTDWGVCSRRWPNASARASARCAKGNLQWTDLDGTCRSCRSVRNCPAKFFITKDKNIKLKSEPFGHIRLTTHESDHDHIGMSTLLIISSSRKLMLKSRTDHSSNRAWSYRLALED